MKRRHDKPTGPGRPVLAHYPMTCRLLLSRDHLGRPCFRPLNTWRSRLVCGHDLPARDLTSKKRICGACEQGTSPNVYDNTTQTWQPRPPTLEGT